MDQRSNNTEELWLNEQFSWSRHGAKQFKYIKLVNAQVDMITLLSVIIISISQIGKWSQRNLLTVNHIECGRARIQTEGIWFPSFHM